MVVAERRRALGTPEPARLRPPSEYLFARRRTARDAIGQRTRRGPGPDDRSTWHRGKSRRRHLRGRSIGDGGPLVSAQGSQAAVSDGGQAPAGEETPCGIWA